MQLILTGNRDRVMNKLLEIRNLKTHFQMRDHVVRAVDGIDLDLNYGETLGIVGESGCGKSVLSLSMMRLIQSPPGKILQGEIFLEGEDLLKAPEQRMREIRGNKIGMIFQEPMTSLNPLYTVGSQISETLILHKAMDKNQALEKCINLLSLVGIPSPEERIKEYPFQLSGGMRQRVMIAMALACEPPIIIADEPTTALDVTIQSQILRLMGSLKEKTKSSILFITHDLAVIAGFADRVMVLYAGKVMEMAPVKTLFKNPMHPYTKGLMASIPVIGKHKFDSKGNVRYLSIIKGNLPDPRQFPKGCRFASRCESVMPKCLDTEPSFYTGESGQFVRCYLYE